MLDSIRARLKRATDRRRQADRASSVLATERLLPEGLIGEPVQELLHTRPQTADVSSLSRLEVLKENEGRLGVEPQLREAKQRPKTSQSASRKKAEARLAGRNVEVLSMENARGWPLGNRRSLVVREPALRESPLQISTMPLRDPQASPRNNQIAAASCDAKETASKSSTAALQPSSKHRQPLRKSGDWTEERRAKTSHGSRGRSPEEDQSTVSPRKRVQSARYVQKTTKSDEGSPKDGQENIATINTQPDGPSPYKPRSESRVSSKSRLHLVETAEKSPRKRPGSFRVPSALVSALGTSNGSQENVVIHGNAQKKQERNEPVLKEGSRAGSATSKAKTKALREAAGKKVAKGETSLVRVGAPQLEWRERNPQTDKEQLAIMSAPEETARRKSAGDEVPKKTAAVSRRPRRRSLESESTLLLSSSGPVVSLDTLEDTGSPVSTEEGSPSNIGCFAREAASTLVDQPGHAKCSLTGLVEHTLARSSFEAVDSSQTSKLPAALVSRGANRPSTPSPFAIVSRKNNSDEKPVVLQIVVQAAKESGPLVAECNLTEQRKKMGLLNPAQAASGNVAQIPAVAHAGRKVPEKRVKSELDESETLDSADESSGAGKSKHLRLEGPAKEEEAAGLESGVTGAASAKHEETKGDVKLEVTRPDSKAALVEGQQAEQKFASECAALIAWMGFSSEALIQDICESAVLPVTPSPRLRAELRKATQSPLTPSKGSPRGSPKGPPRSPRSSGKQSPVSRLSPLWIPP